MKKCSSCRKELELDLFSPSQRERRGAKCKECTKEYSKSHYQKHKDRQIEQSKDRATRYGLSNLKSLLKLLEQGCKDCGNKNALVLEFDHLDPLKKSFNIATRIKTYSASSKLLQEAEKCDIVCRNCHVIREHKRQNSLRYRLVTSLI